MTLTEIEETLSILEQRHSGLNEGGLVTLLRAGGWEEKQIEEAKMVFRSRGHVAKAEVKISSAPLPPLPVVPVFSPAPQADHLLNAHNEVKVERVESPEPESLVTRTVTTQVITKESKKEELPHNLPLRPFETSEHIWPFSRYKDIFYGEGEVEKREGTKIETTEIKTKYVVPPRPQAPPPVIVSAPEPHLESVLEKSIDRIIEKHVEKQKSFAPYTAPSSRGGDEKIVILACIMLLVILLLLGYMYSNGRL